MKRFYRAVEVAEERSGFGIRLDGRPVRTPGRAPLVVTSRPLAEAIAAEWAAQAETILPRTMPMTRLASTAVDRVTPQREQVIDDVAAYAGTDLVCYRAAAPPDLVHRQHESWQPLVDWAALSYDAPLVVTTGMMPVGQPREALGALRAAVAAHDDFALAALVVATQASGSLVVALALATSRLDPEAAFAAAQIDETHQIERWGEDEELAERRAAIRADLEEAARFLALLR